jgi:ribonucleoside-diphosphate reductase alpha chain
MIENRRRLPDERKSVTRRIKIHYKDELDRADTLDIYAHVGLYEDGTPGELFITAGKAGGTVSGLLGTLAISVSIGLQAGVPLAWYVAKFKGMKFEPAGMTGDAEIGIAHSIVDALARWLEKKFPVKEGT